MYQRKTLVYVILVALVISSALALYSGARVLSLEQEKASILDAISKKCVSYMYRVGEDIRTLLHLLEENSTVDAVRYKAEATFYNAYMLAELTQVLYDHTGEDKYLKLHGAFCWLYNFLMDVLSDEPSNTKPILVKNSRSLDEVASLVLEIASCGDLKQAPADLVEQLYDAASQLSKYK